MKSLGIILLKTALFLSVFGLLAKLTTYAAIVIAFIITVKITKPISK